MTEQTKPRGCAICGVGSDAHAEAENEGVLNHRFSKNGELVSVKEKKKDEVPAGMHTVPSGDPVLRYLLISKGVITVDELTEAEETLKATGFLRT